MKILSPMPRGNGAWVVHQELATGLNNYNVCDFDPRWGFFPPALYGLCGSQADIIHGVADFGAVPTSKDQKLVLSFHNYVCDPDMRAIVSLAQSLFYRFGLRPAHHHALKHAHTVTAVSHYTANLVKTDMAYKGDIRVIYNGIDLQRFHPVQKRNSNAPLKILFAANMSRRKGAHLLPAMADALPDGLVIQYLPGLRGKGRLPDHPRLEPLTSVSYEDMHRLYQQADMVLYPSYREGFGLVAAEGMACGLPIVTSNNSSLPEVVDEAKGGFLCKTGSAQAHVDAILQLADSADVRIQMGKHNRARAEQRFDQQDMLKSYQLLFEEVMDTA